MRLLLINITLLLIVITPISANDVKLTMTENQKRLVQSYYDTAFHEIELMLLDSINPSFKKAVFLTENAFLDNRMSYEKFCGEIENITQIVKLFDKANDLKYSYEDKEEIEKLGAIYYLMTDTVNIILNDNLYHHLPFKYNFEDIWGEKDWSNMFVSNLLMTHKGNCHSLPFLYKILAEEMNVNAHLALAPNHFYIKSKCKRGGWYNTELTSATFPIDAWIMASGYISVQAVQNRLYMDTLSLKQSLAICLTDLAQGYNKRFGVDANLNFTLKCTELALKYYPNYVNALLFRAETLKLKFDKFAKLHEHDNNSENTKKDANMIFEEMEAAYVNIHQLGYRTMPKEMYLQWLMELNQEKNKYLNKKIISNFKTK